MEEGEGDLVEGVKLGWFCRASRSLVRPDEETLSIGRLYSSQITSSEVRSSHPGVNEVAIGERVMLVNPRVRVHKLILL